MSRLFSSGGQSIRASVLAEVFPVLPMTIQGWFPLGLTGLTVFSYHNSKASILQHSTFFMVQLSDLYMITGKTITLIVWTFVSKVVSAFLICCLGLSYFFFQGASVF